MNSKTNCKFSLRTTHHEELPEKNWPEENVNVHVYIMWHNLKSIWKCLWFFYVKLPTCRSLPPANEVCEGYVFTGVCLSTLGGAIHGFIQGACMVLFGGACVVLFGGACVVSFRGCMVSFGGCAWFYLGGGHAWFYSGGHAWFFQFFRIQWDTINEQAVRILLECILVRNKCYLWWGLNLVDILWSTLMLTWLNKLGKYWGYLTSLLLVIN